MSLTAEQHALRRTGITGSEIATLAGLNPYGAPIDVYRRKVEGETVEESHHMRRGQFMEPAIIEWYKYETGRKVRDVGTLSHPLMPLVIATPDGISSEQDGSDQRVIEIKSPGPRTFREWGPSGTDEFPKMYRPQLSWECAVTGLDKADLVADVGGELRVYPFEFDAFEFELLYDVAQRFWTNHVLTKTPPPPDASDSARDYLRSKSPRAELSLAHDDGSAEQWVAQYRKATKEVDYWDHKKQEARNNLEALIGSHEGIDGTWGKILFRNNKDGTAIDYKALVERMQPSPELVKEFTKIKPGPRVFRPYFEE